MAPPRARIVFLFCAWWSTVRAATPVAEAEALQVTTARRLSIVCAAAQRDGWAAQVPPLRAAAIAAYRHDKPSAAEAWFHVYRWADLFARDESAFFEQWVGAVNAARVGHANMPTRFAPASRPLGMRVSPALQSWLVANPGFSAEFFSLLSPVDYLPRVLEILAELHARNPAGFGTHAHLALALAIVYDVPPPPYWPHNQVAPSALPRTLPSPVDAFAWWVRQEQLGRTYHRPSRLGAHELKFVVDASAPLAELEWAQRSVSLPLNQFAGAYSMIRYRRDRVTSRQPVWPGSSYTLPDILNAGGICPDQAYFATQTGKARGVPTLLFAGAGNDGRHAWFGFLDGNRKWQLDAGRYAEQQLVTGYAIDPQTWGVLSDHELRFLSERFRELPSYRQSRVHAAFAADFMAAGDLASASAAARRAVTFERRNERGWEILVESARRAHREPKAIESLLREAALAFQLYPDLQAQFTNRVAESLRARGQTSEADAETRRIAVKNQNGRGDLSLQQARDRLVRSMTTEPLPTQIQTYNGILDSYGRGAGIAFFDQVVQPFVEYLLAQSKRSEARAALERARRVLKIEPNSQLAGEFAEVQESVRSR